MIDTSVKTTRPEGTKIHRRKGTYYVYHVTGGSYVKKGKKRYVAETRRCIGRLVEKDSNEMYPNENFAMYYPEESQALPRALPEPPQFSDTLKAGGMVTVRALAARAGITEILKDIYSEEVVAELLDVICYIELGQSAALQHCPSFMSDHLQLGRELRSDAYLCKLLKDNLTDENIQEFLRRWNKPFIEQKTKIYVSFDGTNFNWEASDSEVYSEFGCAKDDETKPQVNVHVALKHDDGTPLDYDTYNGSIVDMAQCSIVIDRLRDYGYREVGGIFDRGYYFESVIKKLDEAGFDFIMMTVACREEIKELLKEHRNALHNQAETWDYNTEVCGLTVKKEFCGRERYFHLCYDDAEAGRYRKNALKIVGALRQELCDLKGKKLRKNTPLAKFKKWFELEIETRIETLTPKGRPAKHPKKVRVLKDFHEKKAKLKEHLDSLGHFCLMTTENMDAGTALEIYRFRDNIEKLFRHIKWSDDFSVPKVHSDEAFDARMHLIFIACIIYSRLVQISRELKTDTKNKREYTVPGMIDLLEGIRCTLSPKNLYRRRYAVTAKQRAILEKAGVQDADIDRAVSEFNSRHGFTAS